MMENDPEIAGKLWDKTLKRIDGIRSGFVAGLKLIASDLARDGFGSEATAAELKQACRRNLLGRALSDSLLDKTIAEGFADGQREAATIQRFEQPPDPWEAIVAKLPANIIHTSPDKRELVSTKAVLAHGIGIPIEQQRPWMGRRLQKAMLAQGWFRNPSGAQKMGNTTVRGYWRFVEK